VQRERTRFIRYASDIPGDIPGISLARRWNSLAERALSPLNKPSFILNGASRVVRVGCATGLVGHGSCDYHA
jgi:hypothetical protein